MTGVAPPVRIACWSGPRNISTAMMRSWEARGDCAVSDEPLYAHYLSATGADHPDARRVIKHHGADWRPVVEELLGPVPGDRPIWYQKHMAHHLLPSMERNWIDGLTNVLLIRDPAAMIASLARVLPRPTLPETGLPQQVALFERFTDRSGEPPPVIDARDVLENPAALLRVLCERVGVPYTSRMLAWPPGLRPTDGVWAPHWYGRVAESTGFAPWQPPSESPPADLEDLVAEARPMYERLHAHRLRAAGSGPDVEGG